MSKIMPTLTKTSPIGRALAIAYTNGLMTNEEVIRLAYSSEELPPRALDYVNKCTGTQNMVGKVYGDIVKEYHFYDEEVSSKNLLSLKWRDYSDQVNKTFPGVKTDQPPGGSLQEVLESLGESLETWRTVIRRGHKFMDLLDYFAFVYPDDLDLLKMRDTVYDSPFSDFRLMDEDLQEVDAIDSMLDEPVSISPDNKEAALACLHQALLCVGNDDGISVQEAIEKSLTNCDNLSLQNYHQNKDHYDGIIQRNKKDWDNKCFEKLERRIERISQVLFFFAAKFDILEETMATKALFVRSKKYKDTYLAPKH